MFNFNINWLKIIKEHLPADLRVISVIEFLQVVISPFVEIYGEFMAKYQVLVYKVRFTGQVIYLEKILNDKFSPTSGGIYIVDGQTTPKKYLYRKSEGKPPQYRYRKWKGTYNYVPGDFGIYGNKVYKCLAAHTNILPLGNPTYWVYHTEVTYRRRNAEFNIQFNFIVKVPASLTFDSTSMRAIIDYYRLAGKRYKIETY